MAIVFGDLVSFSSIVRTQGELVSATFLGRYLDLVRDIARNQGARIVKTTGDGFFATFTGVPEAVVFCLELKGQLAKSDAQIRLSISYGRIRFRESELGDDIYGSELVRAARLNSIAGPGQILISAEASHLVPKRYLLLARGMQPLKGFEEPVAVGKSRKCTSHDKSHHATGRRRSRTRQRPDHYIGSDCCR